MSFALPPITTIFPGAYTVKKGDTLEGICLALGQPGWAYDELVAANPQLAPRGLYGHRSPPGLGLKVGLLVGDAINVPAAWSLSTGPVASSLGVDPATITQLFPYWKAAKAVNDANNIDANTALLFPFIDLLMAGKLDPQGPLTVALPESWRPGITNAVVSWWRSNHPNDAPDLPGVTPYLTSARRWMYDYGASLGEEAASIPWARLPLDQAAPYLPRLGAAPIDWKRVRSWMVERVPVEALTPQALPAPQTQEYRFNQALWGLPRYKQIPWAKIPWAVVPWNLIPWGKMELSRVYALTARGASKSEVTNAFLRAVANVYGLQAPGGSSGQSSADPKGPPGGRPPGPITNPPDVILPPAGDEKSSSGSGTAASLAAWALGALAVAGSVAAAAAVVSANKRKRKARL